MVNCWLKATTIRNHSFMFVILLVIDYDRVLPATEMRRPQDIFQKAINAYCIAVLFVYCTNWINKHKNGNYVELNFIWIV